MKVLKMQSTLKRQLCPTTSVSDTAVLGHPRISGFQHVHEAWGSVKSSKIFLCKTNFLLTLHRNALTGFLHVNGSDSN